MQKLPKAKKIKENTFSHFWHRLAQKTATTTTTKK
jgi:hypothetical protein